MVEVRTVPVGDLVLDDFASAIRWHYDAQTEPHETTFEIFRHFPGEEEMLLDIGANIGNSVVSFRLCNKHAKIFSLEPLEVLRPAMDAIKIIEGDRFDFRMAGASDRAGELLLYVPSANNKPVFYLASLDSARFGPDPVRIKGMQALMGRPLTEEYGITEIPVRLLTVDSLNLEPTLVKIDAEGHEFGVLSGMKNTIDRSRPLFLMEGGNMRSEIVNFMSDRDYSFAKPLDGKMLISLEPTNADGFFLPNEKHESYRRKGALI